MIVYEQDVERMLNTKLTPIKITTINPQDQPLTIAYPWVSRAWAVRFLDAGGAGNGRLWVPVAELEQMPEPQKRERQFDFRQ